MSLSGDIYTDKIFLAQTRPAKDHSPKLKRKHEPCDLPKKAKNSIIRQHSNKLETASDQTRIEQG